MGMCPSAVKEMLCQIYSLPLNHKVSLCISFIPKIPKEHTFALSDPQ